MCARHSTDTVSTVSPSISHEVMGLDVMILVFLAEGLGAGGVHTAKASRGESSFRGKGSAPGCIPKLVLPRPD